VLLGLSFATGDDGAPEPVVLTLTRKAKQVWISFYNTHAAEHAELSGDLAAAWSKLEGYAARLALIVQLVRAATGEATADQVDDVSMVAGITLTRWFGIEARRVYAALAESDEERDTRRLLELIERKGGEISIRELQAGDRRYRGSADLAESALTALVQAGLGAWQDIPPGPRGGRPGRVFRLCQHISSQRNLANVQNNNSSADADNAESPHNMGQQ